MQARMKQPALVVPEALHALLSVGKATARSGVPKQSRRRADSARKPGSQHVGRGADRAGLSVPEPLGVGERAQ